MNSIDNKELKYAAETSSKHLKKYGQYFTNSDIAYFMSKWAIDGAANFLDPAVGNSIFLKHARELKPDCDLVGYEIDEKILNYFGNPAKATIRKEDYLLNGWEEKYDAIVCNPPYNRFQAVSNRDEILDDFYEHLGTKYSGYTNLYVLFLLKSIYQMKTNGRLAYIIPSEFLNSKYGEAIKKKLVEERLIKAIINFQNNDELFFNATTTSCILLLDKTPKEEIHFYNLLSPQEIVDLNIDVSNIGITVKYEDINYKDKWRSFLNQEDRIDYKNLVKVSSFCTVTRGIATGANDYFCFNKSKIKKYGIPLSSLTKCITKSAQVKKIVFTEKDFENLYEQDKLIYLLDVKTDDGRGIKEYITLGEKEGVNKKYLPSQRKPWYSMEQKIAAPIWVCPANRNSVKFVRNLAGIKTLTTFHSVMVKDLFADYTNVIFCYFITPIAQEILRENRKELGNGLEKFQPNDLNYASMLDVTKLKPDDINRIKELFNVIKNKNDQECIGEIKELNSIFEQYLK